MLGKWLSLLRPAPYLKPILDPNKIQSEYRYWRIRIMYSLFLGYTIFYFTRKSFTAVAPFIADDLTLTKAQIGLLGSVLYITYGISKFLSGVMADRSNPRYFMAFGLILTGFFNILFGMSSSLWLLAIFWGLNGWFQAWGWPACCKSLTYWFNRQERGLWYSIASTSHNVGGALIPVLMVYCALELGWGWRYAMLVPAVTSIIMGLVLMNRMRDVPQSLGLPEIERRDEAPAQTQPKKHSRLPARQIILNQVLNNKYVWIFALSYFFVYVVRTAVNDWTMFYLPEVKGTTEHMAAIAVSGFEIGGLFGMIVAGWGSDYFFKGNRIPTVVLSALGLVMAVLALWNTPHGHASLDIFFITLIGFFVYGPQAIVGLAAAEFVDKRAASAANGFSGTLGYFGAASGCYLVGEAIDIWGWDGFFISILVCSALVFILLLPLWSLKEPAEEEVMVAPGKPTKASANI